MKYTIEGFSQKELVILNMDLTDAVILRWFIDFKDTGKMYSEIVGDEKYYWIKYEGVIEDLPIISLVKTTLGKRIRRLAEIGVLKHYTKKQNGTFSMYAVGEKYAPLVDFEIKKEDKKLDFDEIKGIKKPKGIPQDEQGVFLKMNTGCSAEGTTNNSSIKETNLLNKSESKELISDLPKKSNQVKICKTMPAIVKELAKSKKFNLDENLIETIAINFEIETINELFNRVPKDVENAGAYINTCIKNGTVIIKKTVKAKKAIEVPAVLEEPKKEKPSREKFIKEYLGDRKLEQLTPIEKSILNKTLKGMGHEQIKQDN